MRLRITLIRAENFMMQKSDKQISTKKTNVSSIQLVWETAIYKLPHKWFKGL